MGGSGHYSDPHAFQVHWDIQIDVGWNAKALSASCFLSLLALTSIDHHRVLRLLSTFTPPGLGRITGRTLAKRGSAVRLSIEPLFVTRA
jgi:hypothetical protein